MNDTPDLTAEYAIKLINRAVALVQINTDKKMGRELKTLRTDGPQYNFMNYLLTHPKTVTTRADIHENVEGCKSISDLTELVRHCGFNSCVR